MKKKQIACLALGTAMVAACFGGMGAVPAFSQAAAGQPTAVAAAETDETDKKDKTKEEYLKELEDAVNQDLTSLDNLKAAKSKIDEMEQNDEQFTDDARYTAAYDKLKTAIETYLDGQIEKIDAALDAKYTDFYDFANAVAAPFDAVSLDLLLEENEELTAAYDALKTKKEAHPFGLINARTPNDAGYAHATQNSDGIYFEQKGVHGERLNYNKPLDLCQGATVEVQLDEVYCFGDVTSLSNNLFFNFLANPNSYKSTCEGICIMVWLFAGESAVHVYQSHPDSHDVAVEDSASAVAVDIGSTLKISVKYGPCYQLGQSIGDKWRITVNETELAPIDDDKLTLDKTCPSLLKDDNTAPAYFSMGSYANDAVFQAYPDGRNAMTLLSVNGDTFAKPAPTSVTVGASKTEAEIGETVTFTANVAPDGFEAEKISWYVNGTKQSATGLSLQYTAAEAGEYSVYCVVDGTRSATVKLTVAGPGGNGNGSGQTPDGNGSGSQQNTGLAWWAWMLIAIAVVVCVIGVCVLVKIKKKKKKN